MEASKPLNSVLVLNAVEVGESTLTVLLPVLERICPAVPILSETSYSMPIIRSVAGVNAHAFVIKSKKTEGTIDYSLSRWMPVCLSASKNATRGKTGGALFKPVVLGHPHGFPTLACCCT